MPTYESSRTFESSIRFEKYGQKFGTVLAGAFISAGLINAVDEIKDYAAAESSSLCYQPVAAKCGELKSTERNDSLVSGLGGLAGMTALSYLVVKVSRRPEATE